MYKREITPPPDAPVKDGKAQFGTFSGPFKNFDIRGLKHPFGSLPIPQFLTNFRVRGMVRFLFCSEENIGEIELFMGGFFGFMETTLWNRRTKKRIAYRRMLAPRSIRMPHNLFKSIIACRSHSRFVRINMRLYKKVIHADFDFLGSDIRPPCEARLAMNLDGPGTAEIATVVPYEIKRRCKASYKVTAPLHGRMTTFYDDYNLSEQTSVGFFEITEAYLSLRTKLSMLNGFGMLDGKVVSFSLSNSTSRDDYRYNENVLFVDGKAYPLPPVKITRPYGVEGQWIIQDTESMIDLVFTPVSDSPRKLSIVILRTDYHTVYGTFEGVLLTGDNKKIVLKDYPGIGKKILLRI
ncbi:DUF2804 domain-containing protein [Brucepastera parasyntrophica]|uniref:DUF2804 family protein n=1 Tax=Brucepastera parasyntrophica TaxID=2880008 RepID=UPI0021099FEC|nr:DUF2804 family protein [Brucepastera parasyntrophica]ULQ58814.1 DUF2804 domain-containing protein [Brucepastera parasyntrophica]